MKKLMILAALGTAALFTACGDDSSSGASESCEVSVNDNSVVVTASVAGYSSTTTYTVTETGYSIKSEAEGQEPITTDVPTQMTVDQLKEIADKECKAFEEAETVPAE